MHRRPPPAARPYACIDASGWRARRRRRLVTRREPRLGPRLRRLPTPSATATLGSAWIPPRHRALRGSREASAHRGSGQERGGASLWLPSGGGGRPLALCPTRTPRLTPPSDDYVYLWHGHGRQTKGTRPRPRRLLCGSDAHHGVVLRRARGRGRHTGARHPRVDPRADVRHQRRSLHASHLGDRLRATRACARAPRDDRARVQGDHLRTLGIISQTRQQAPGEEELSPPSRSPRLAAPVSQPPSLAPICPICHAPFVPYATTLFGRITRFRLSI